MRIAINARLLCDPRLRGFNRYTINLLAELSSRPEVKLLLYSDREVHSEHLARLSQGTYELIQSASMRYVVWEQCWLPNRLRIDRADIYHSPVNLGIPAWAPCPTVLTVHDAIDQVFYRPRQPFFARVKPSTLWSSILQSSARASADIIITVSHHAKGDLVKHLRIPEDKIRVIYEAADPKFFNGETSRNAGFTKKRPYFLYVGGWEGRKNIPFLVKAFALAAIEEFDLLLVGGSDLEREEIRELSGNLKVLDRIRLVGWIADSELPGLYTKAHCFVYPSRYEGFGLQLCEAMAKGCPVLSSSGGSLPEILGIGGELFDPSDLEELAMLLRRLAKDEAFRVELATRARERSQQFSWSVAATETIVAYNEAIALHRVRREAKAMHRKIADYSATDWVRSFGLKLTGFAVAVLTRSRNLAGSIEHDKSVRGNRD